MDSAGTNAVYEYSGSTGAFLRTFVAALGSGRLSNPAGLVFGPDSGNLYVGSVITQSIPTAFQGPRRALPPAAHCPQPGSRGRTSWLLKAAASPGPGS